MGPGTYLSGLGHVGLVGWLVFGAGFTPRPQVPEITPVTIVSPAVFDPVLAAPQPTAIQEQPAELEPTPVAAETQTPTAQDPDTAPPRVDPVDSEPAPSLDAVPVTDPTPAVEPSLGPPDLTLTSSVRPKPRPAVRVTNENTAGEDTPTTADPVTATVDADTAPAADPVDVETPPTATASEIVTEAETPSGAPTSSKRPNARPAPQVAQEEPAQDDNGEALAAALAEALSGAEEPAPPAPLTAAELQGLQLQMHCWNVGSLSTDALATKIVVAVELTRDARPVPSSIQLVEVLEGSQSGADQAFEAAKRGILECGASGFDLPDEKFPLWRRLELVFNPESMRAK